MVRTNTSSVDGILESTEWRNVFLREARGGRAVVVAGDVLPEDDSWMLLLGFVVGEGRMDLVAHLVMRTPDQWFGASPKEDPEHSSVLVQFAELVELHSHTTGPLTTALVRSAATTELEMYVRRYLNHRHGGGSSSAESSWHGEVDPGPTRKSRGPANRSDLRLARIAQRYVEVCAVSKSPKKVLSSEFHLAENTVQSYLHLARERGFLSRPGRGSAGGFLSAEATAILNKGEN